MGLCPRIHCYLNLKTPTMFCYFAFNLDYVRNQKKGIKIDYMISLLVTDEIFFKFKSFEKLKLNKLNKKIK